MTTRWALVLVVMTACSGRRAVLRERVADSMTAGPTAQVTLREPMPVKVERVPCPASPTPKGTLANVFRSLPSPGGAVERLERLMLNVATVSSFVQDDTGLALSLLLQIPEAGASLPVLRRTSGELVAVPALSEPFMLKGRPAGMSYSGGRWPSFWHDGTCEVLEDGPVGALRGAGNGEVVGVRSRPGQPRDVVLRRVDGTWWSMGELPHEVELWPSTDSGRITLAWSRFDGVGLTAAAQFPDLGRTEVVQRSAKFQPRHLYGGITPARVPWGGSRFSPPLMLDLDWEKTGALVLERPARAGGFERLPLATVKPERGCEQERDGAEQKTTRVTVSRPELVTLDTQRTLVAWVEDRLRCRFEPAPEPSEDACPGCPRRARERDVWVPKRTSRHLELVLLGVDDDVGELQRVELPATLEEHSLSGVSLAVRDGRVLVFAQGYLVELDQRKLEAGW
ncbi:MAG: hypothetical protein JNJ54_31080 [Myxococcaceae bacterium]|nr:hypothetical protein [Myxococcaceae bacterium]